MNLDRDMNVALRKMGAAQDRKSPDMGSTILAPCLVPANCFTLA